MYDKNNCFHWSAGHRSPNLSQYVACFPHGEIVLLTHIQPKISRSIRIFKSFSVEFPVSSSLSAWVIVTLHHVLLLIEFHKVSPILLSFTLRELLTFVMLVTVLLPHKSKCLLDVLCLSWNTYSLTFIPFIKF